MLYKCGNKNSLSADSAMTPHRGENKSAVRIIVGEYAAVMEFDDMYHNDTP